MVKIADEGGSTASTRERLAAIVDREACLGVVAKEPAANFVRRVGELAEHPTARIERVIRECPRRVRPHA